MVLCPGVRVASPENAISTEDMRAFEINAENLGVSIELLMENAGNAVAGVLECLLGGLQGAKVAVLAGKGGNGGDGIAAARRLAARGARVEIHLTHPRGEVKHPASRTMLKGVEASRVEVVEPGAPGWLDLGGVDAVVDALLGIGVKGGLRGSVKAAAEAYNKAGGLKISVDVPTGVDPDTGDAVEGAVRSDYTVSMHRPKKGLFKGAAPLYAGEVLTAEIGVPWAAEYYAGPGDVAARIPRRPRDAHKGVGGRVLVVGGSSEYVGAPILAALAAYAAGVDLVYLASPFSREAALARPEIVPRRMEEASRVVERVHAVVAGPGMGGEGEDLLWEVLDAARKRGVPAVVDADGLKALARRGDRLWGGAVLTPHRGEAKLLLGGEDLPPLRAAREIAARYGATTIVKAPVDAVCSPEGRCRESPWGAPEMSVGGTGDVLAGVLAGFLARRRALGMDPDPLNTAAAALYTVGKAGEDLAMEEGLVSPLRLVEAVKRVVAGSRA
ncbi:NAD(P)H-hydrate dehydratase [Aeropyrum pernix]|nr:NAD(P)H-hydrate dehydratase [Aeropyrum pernix]